MKVLASISRIIIGLVFIFSGFVKSVDPYGTAYKIEEYLNVFGLNSLVNSMDWLPIVSSIILCSLEFVIGIMLVSFIFRKYVNWITILMMSFFTVLTFIDALTNKVSDCGCFGDAVVLTNWETFFKNVIIDILLVIAVIFDKRETQNKLERLYSNTFTILVIVFVLIFSIYNSVYEPMVDFRAWKIGNRIVPSIEDQKPPISYVEYKNNKTSEIKEFDMDELMLAYQNDTAFAENWTFVNSRVVDFNKVNADGFSMQGYNSTGDEALSILSSKDTLYLITIPFLDDVCPRSIEVVKGLYSKTNSLGQSAYILTATSQTRWEEWQRKNDLEDAILYSSDDKAIKTIMRSSPGIVMMSDGVVLDKWSWRLYSN